MSNFAPPSQRKYRRGVAVVVTNEQGELLACERSDFNGAWQLPQGGVEAEETDEEAMRRELAEEIGLTEYELVGRLDSTISYDWPAHLHSRGHSGQEHVYFLVKTNANTRIDLTVTDTPEFARVEWVTLAEFNNRISGFKAEAYRAALKQFVERFPKSFR